MPSYPQGLPDNVNYLQQQILRSGTARLGPVSLKPGEGHIRMNDGTNDTGFLDFNGIQLRYRGGMRGLTELTESFANSIEAHAGRLDGLEAAVVRIDAKDAAQDASLALKAWTSYVDQQDGLLSGRVTTAQSTANAAQTAASNAQSRADAAHALATGRATVASVTTAQNRANAAYTLAEGRVTDAELAAQVTRLANAIMKVALNTNTPDPFLP